MSPVNLGLDFDFADGDLVELDADEIEELLNNKDMNNTVDSFLSPSHGMVASNPIDLDTNFDLMNCSQKPMIIEDFPHDSTVLNNARIGHEDQSAGDCKNILLISIQKPLQTSAAFDNIPTVNLDVKDIMKITVASAGHDGVYLKPKESAIRSEKIVRRPPLQVIQQIDNHIAKKVSQAELKAPCKRKQRFNLTRDDRIIFEMTPTPCRHSDPTRHAHKNQTFQWAPTDDEDTEEATEIIEDSNRCPGCKKVYKKLSQHKCKKLITDKTLPAETVTRPTINHSKDKKKKKTEKTLCSCEICGLTFKTKKAIVTHLSICAKNDFTARRDPEKRILRSHAKK